MKTMQDCIAEIQEAEKALDTARIGLFRAAYHAGALPFLEYLKKDREWWKTDNDLALDLAREIANRDWPMDAKAIATIFDFAELPMSPDALNSAGPDSERTVIEYCENERRDYYSVYGGE